MADLSPAAQAVMHTYEDWLELPIANQRYGPLAAALRAVVEQLGETHAGFDLADRYGRFVEADDILAIAAELEGDQ